MQLGLTAWGIMLGFAGLIVIIAGLAQAAKNASYAKSSGDVTAKLIRKSSIKGNKGPRRYEFRVVYTVDGISYKRNVLVPAQAYNDTEEGSDVELKYKPQNPKKVVYPSELDPRNARTVLIIGAVMLVIGVVLFMIERL